MKKNAIILSFCAALLLWSSPGHAMELSKTEDADFHRAWGKFKRGVVNVLTSPLEVPKQVKMEVKENSSNGGEAVLAGVGGTVKGLAYFAGRLTSGLWDMVGCNLAVPDDYQPIMYPEYVVESWSK
ncbi:MAG: exosortase system-associated protein, TIGR04073 family [Candidatus Omnitrophica bacterium]|nr:exosortase system-associated protein, TIGR04073 family [Candidatus Omnitrophota bacterium]